MLEDERRGDDVGGDGHEAYVPGATI